MTARAFATILETIRALKARGIASRHPIQAVFTDGEEYGLLGANAPSPTIRPGARATGIVINMEGARQQWPQPVVPDQPRQTGGLIDLYAAKRARAMPRVRSMPRVYRFLPKRHRPHAGSERRPSAGL